jgi:hypothetical protein
MRSWILLVVALAAFTAAALAYREKTADLWGGGSFRTAPQLSALVELNFTNQTPFHIM